jgi:hypothetical protein
MSKLRSGSSRWASVLQNRSRKQQQQQQQQQRKVFSNSLSWQIGSANEQDP